VCSLKEPADQLYRHGYEALQAMAEGLLFYRQLLSFY
jgi:hypothetical protein